MFDTPDFQLVWPRDLFVAEASALVALGRATEDSLVELLLDEAFSGDGAIDAYRMAPSRQRLDPRAFGTTSPVGSGAGAVKTVSQEGFLTALIEHADTLRMKSPPAPYWPQRHGALARQALLGIDHAKQQFDQLIAQMQNAGYLDNEFGRSCVDDSYTANPDPSARLLDMLGEPDLWPLRPPSWTDDVFFGLVEAFHDLVARPRDRRMHSYSNCGWHYSSFAITPAQRLFRHRINAIFGRTDVPLRMAETGEDAGRLVRIVPDDREVLVQRALATPDPRAVDLVQHAVALFRGRTATVQDHRSAIVSLAHVLESRRNELKAELLSADEGALFQIANRFAIRHESAGQQADYDPAFLEWVFWWYLATIELTDRLRTRASAGQPGSNPGME